MPHCVLELTNYVVGDCRLHNFLTKEQRAKLGGLQGLHKGGNHAAFGIKISENGRFLFLSNEATGVEHDDHVGVLKCGASGNVQELDELLGKSGSRALGDVVRHTQAGGPQLFGESVEFLGIQSLGNVEELVADLDGLFPDFQILEAEDRLYGVRKHAVKSKERSTA